VGWIRSLQDAKREVVKMRNRKFVVEMLGEGFILDKETLEVCEEIGSARRLTSMEIEILRNEIKHRKNEEQYRSCKVIEVF